MPLAAPRNSTIVRDFVPRQSSRGAFVARPGATKHSPRPHEDTGRLLAVGLTLWALAGLALGAAGAFAKLSPPAFGILVLVLALFAIATVSLDGGVRHHLSTRTRLTGRLLGAGHGVLAVAGFVALASGALPASLALAAGAGGASAAFAFVADERMGGSVASHRIAHATGFALTLALAAFAVASGEAAWSTLARAPAAACAVFVVPVALAGHVAALLAPSPGR